MPTTIVLPHPDGPREVVLALPDRMVADALAITALNQSPPNTLVLQVLAVGLAWPGEAPWVAVARMELEDAAKRVSGAEAWLQACVAKGLENDIPEAKRDLKARRVELAEAERRHRAAAVTLGDEAACRAAADRILAVLPMPRFAVYQAGRALIEEASDGAFAGFIEYQAMVERGFSKAREAAPSSTGSESPSGDAATPSGG